MPRLRTLIAAAVTTFIVVSALTRIPPIRKFMLNE